jgi:hypothetical protein
MEDLRKHGSKPWTSALFSSSSRTTIRVSVLVEQVETALHIAAKNGHEAVVRLLLEHKADVDAKNND